MMMIYNSNNGELRGITRTSPLSSFRSIGFTRHNAKGEQPQEYLPAGDGCHSHLQLSSDAALGQQLQIARIPQSGNDREFKEEPSGYSEGSPHSIGRKRAT